MKKDFFLNDTFFGREKLKETLSTALFVEIN